jgi:hypothetical protein
MPRRDGAKRFKGLKGGEYQGGGTKLNDTHPTKLRTFLETDFPELINDKKPSWIVRKRKRSVHRGRGIDRATTKRTDYSRESRNHKNSGWNRGRSRSAS